MRFELKPRDDLAALHEAFRSTGRVRAPAILQDSQAQQLRDSLLAREDWCLIFNRGASLYELDRTTRDSLTAAQLADLQRAVHNEGRHAFQYFYENVRVPDAAKERARHDDLLFRAADFLNSAPFLDFARGVVGRDDITFSDCQATCYRPGHFLNTHDDDVAGKNRAAAYVLNLTPEWRPEWGGQLQFLDDEGHVAEAWVPRFNSLNLLRVPQKHLVSMVTPLAPHDARRLSLTGWLRTGQPPA